MWGGGPCVSNLANEAQYRQVVSCDYLFRCHESDSVGGHPNLNFTQGFKPYPACSDTVTTELPKLKSSFLAFTRVCVHAKNVWWTILWLLYVFWKYEACKNVIKILKMGPWKVIWRHITHLQLTIFHWLGLSEHHHFSFNTAGHWLSPERRHLE